jgi:hypothetical protein
MKALLFSAALAAFAPPSVPQSNAVTPQEWRFVCKAVNVMGYYVDCRRLKPPTVVVSLIVQDLSPPGLRLNGITYHGEEYIFVNSTLSREDQRTVVIHETVHYVLAATFGKKIGNCEHEEAARIAHTAWDGTAYDGSWRILYGC